MSKSRESCDHATAPDRLSDEYAFETTELELKPLSSYSHLEEDLPRFSKVEACRFGYHPGVTHEDLAHVLQLLPPLKQLSLNCFDGRKAASQLPHLEHLESLLFHAHCDIDLACFPPMPSLVKFCSRTKRVKNISRLSHSLRMTRFDVSLAKFENLQFCEQFQQLERLDLSFSVVESLSGIESCSALREVILQSCSLSGFEELSHLGSLRKLSLSKNKSLTSLKPLQELRLNHLAIHGINKLDSLKPLGAMQELKTLTAAGTIISDEDFGVLYSMGQLAHCVLAKKYQLKVGREYKGVIKFAFSDRSIF